MKKNDVLEGWSYPLERKAFGLKLFDHTFVKSPGNGAYFDCYGGHNGAGSHKLKGASGKGNYAVANCYRTVVNVPPPFNLPDSAGLGTYGTHGVCHQAANRFLYSASGNIKGVTVHKAQAYKASWLLYGTYGRGISNLEPPAPFKPTTTAPQFFFDIYMNCRRKHSKETLNIDDGHSVTPIGFEQSIAALHYNLSLKGNDYDPNAVITEELRLLVGHELGKEFESTKIEEIRNSALAHAHKIGISDLRGKNFAHELNGVVVELLDELEAYLGSENYTRLLNMPPKERFALLDPDIAELQSQNIK